MSVNHDGTRDIEQWIEEIELDARIIMQQIKDLREWDDNERRAGSLALALKEARRLESDLYRIGREIYGIDKATIDAIGRL